VISECAGECKVARITMKAVSPLADFSYDYEDLEFAPASGKDCRLNR
jgi:hypothetical protein